MTLPCLILRRAKARGFAQLLILLIALCAAKTWAQSPVVLVLGDSISAGYGMKLKDGWVQLLAERLQTSHPEWSVVNASISGETTAGGLRRLPALITSHQPQTVIIELGGNDGLRGYPISQLRSNLAQLIQLSAAAGAEVLVSSMEIPPNFGSRYTALFRESFEAAAEGTRATVIPFILSGVATTPALMQADGIHPTEAAQPMILDSIWPYVTAALDRAQ